MLDETVWLTQAQMAELFGKSVKTINEHVKNIFKEGELDPDPTIRKFRIVRTEGDREVTRDIDHYNLDVIISVGYRVRSQQGTRFRQWATARLREYLIKGFTLDDQRLKERRTTDDYFEELLERIRAIRTAEINFYKKILEIYATSEDYDKTTNQARQFFATVQNKLHFAITGMTAAELIDSRADASKPNMGLTSMEGKAIRRKDVVVAKNYLDEEELGRLRLLVDQYLSFAEFQAKNRRIMYMADWAKKLDDFLKLNEQELLSGAGSVKKKDADAKAAGEYRAYQQKLLEEHSAYDELMEQASEWE